MWAKLPGNKKKGRECMSRPFKQAPKRGDRNLVLRLDGVRKSHRELERVALGRRQGWGSIVQVSINRAYAETKVLVSRKRQDVGFARGIRARSVIGGYEFEVLRVGHHFGMKQIREGKCRSDQILLSPGSATNKFLLLILNRSFQVGLLLFRFRKRPAKSAAVDLLELEVLCEVVDEGRLNQREKS